MNQAVYVTGGGIISAVGNDVAATLHAFENHHSGIGFSKHLATVHKSEFPLGEVELSNEALASKHNLPPHLSRTILLSYHAAVEATQNIEDTDWLKYRVGFISATSVGGMDKSEFFFEEYLEDPLKADLRKVAHHDCGKATDYVAEQLGIKGFVTTISTACSSSANSIMLAARMIKAGQLDIVVAGGVDALTRFTLNGFNSLMIVDKEQCRPLDGSRMGLNLGEGAAYLVLMSQRVAMEMNQPLWCQISGYFNANDSHHQTALSEQGNGPYLAMTGALKMAGIGPDQIGYINMHGTGTQNNDSAESKALERIFHPRYPKLSSTKSFTGHTLGASGGIEALLSAVALRDQLVYPNFSFNEPVAGSSIIPEATFKRNVALEHVLSNSFGFGGNCTSLIFSRN